VGLPWSAHFFRSLSACNSYKSIRLLLGRWNPLSSRYKFLPLNRDISTSYLAFAWILLLRYGLRRNFFSSRLGNENSSPLCASRWNSNVHRGNRRLSSNE